MRYVQLLDSFSLGRSFSLFEHSKLTLLLYLFQEAVQVALGNFQSQGLTTRNIGLRRISNGAEEMHYHSIGILNEKNWMLWVTSDVPVEIGVTNNGR